MDHAPIYRADEHHTPAPIVPLRRSVSLISAVAALTIGGIALGYHGFAEPGLDRPPAANGARSVSIAVPVPIVALPLVNGGHPDLLAQLTSALVAPVEQVRAIVQPVPLAAPPVPAPLVTLPQPLPAPFLLAVDIAPAPQEAAAVDDDQAAADAEDVAPPESAPAPVARLQQPVRLAPLAVTGQTDPELAEVDAATVEDTPAPQPAAVAPAPPVVVAAAAAPAPKPTAAPAALVRQPTPAPTPVVIRPAQEEPRPRVEIVVKRDEPKPEPQPRHDEGPKPEAKKDAPPPPPPVQQAQKVNNQGPGGHEDDKGNAGPNNAGPQNGGNKGGGGGKGRG